MESIESISKGCFVFKNFNNRDIKSEINSVESWYKCYKNVWNTFEDKIKKLRHKINMNVLQDVIEFIRNAHSYCESPLPVAVLITGINQPDHAEQINSLAKELNDQVTPHIAILFARDCLNIKNAIENMVMQFLVNNKNSELPNTIRKYQCSLLALKSWYQNCYMHKHSMSPSKKQKTKPTIKPFVVIIPDFESFNAKILQDLILLLSSYSSSIPFVLLFGVATSIATVHKTLPHHITSKMFLQIFSSQSSRKTLHQILENIILDPKCTFHLSGSTLKLLIDVFMFYDLSVEGFLNSIKYCMLHHYSNISSTIVLTEALDRKSIKKITSDDIENLRRFPSFRCYVESQQDCQRRIDLLLKDQSVLEILPELISNVQQYLVMFHLTLRILFEFVCGLPQAPLGNELYMLYIKAMTVNISKEDDFKECIQLLNFLSQTEFTEKIINVLSTLEEQKLLIDNTVTLEVINYIHYNFNDFLNQLQIKNLSAGLDNVTLEKQIDISSPNMNRNKMRELLMENTKQKKNITQYESIRKSTINFLIDIVSKYLQPPTTSLTLFELFIFNDLDSVKERIIGSPRAALHVALNSPNYYLQCSCCATDVKDEIISTMPDICVAYKLHLECGRLINLYDWLHAFRHVVTNPNLNGASNDEFEEDSMEIEPEIQARFTSSVAELQHLGFIKTSNKKRDHVTRLTW